MRRHARLMRRFQLHLGVLGLYIAPAAALHASLLAWQHTHAGCTACGREGCTYLPPLTCVAFWTTWTMGCRTPATAAMLQLMYGAALFLPAVLQASCTHVLDSWSLPLAALFPCVLKSPHNVWHAPGAPCQAFACCVSSGDLNGHVRITEGGRALALAQPPQVLPPCSRHAHCTASTVPRLDCRQPLHTSDQLAISWPQRRSPHSSHRSCVSQCRSRWGRRQHQPPKWYTSHLARRPPHSWQCSHAATTTEPSRNQQGCMGRGRRGWRLG